MPGSANKFPKISLLQIYAAKKDILREVVYVELKCESDGDMRINSNLKCDSKADGRSQRARACRCY